MDCRLFLLILKVVLLGEWICCLLAERNQPFYTVDAVSLFALQVPPQQHSFLVSTFSADFLDFLQSVF